MSEKHSGRAEKGSQLYLQNLIVTIHHKKITINRHYPLFKKI